MKYKLTIEGEKFDVYDSWGEAQKEGLRSGLEYEIQALGLLDRIITTSSKRNRVKGQLFTTIGAIASAILLTGAVVSPVGIIALTIIAVASGVKAGTHAIETKND